MAAPSLTNPTIANSETSDVTKLTANDNDLLNAITDGTKDLTFGTLTLSTSPGIKASLLPTDETYSLGNGTYQWTAMYLNNGATDGGAIYFDGGTTTKYLKCNAGGTELSTDLITLVGSDANTTDFPAAKMVVSIGNTGKADSTPMAILAESLVTGATNSYAIMGTTGVDTAASTGIAYGLVGVSNVAHTGGDNVAVYGNAANASGSGTNYAFYGAGGEMLNVGTYAKAAGGTNRAMLVDNTGLFGNATSSLRYKKNIVDIPNTSWIYQLRPVMFDYIDESKGIECSGLIAEEVNEINPRLVTYNDQGQPETVEYHRLIPMLLKEIQNLNERIKLLEAK